MVDTLFEELVSDKSYIEIFNFLDHMPSDMNNKINKGVHERYIHRTDQSSATGTPKKDKIKTVLELID
jgi:hypothetical protein